MDAVKQESAHLILKLYELRREPTMRMARDWMARFNPESAQDVVDAVMGEHSAYYRMVMSYWDMAASFVNNGAIDAQMFADANMEHVFYFAKIEPFLAELREMFNSPRMYAHLEQLVMQIPDAKQRLAMMRERSKRMAEMRRMRETSEAAKAAS
jgi:hypothetical protein